MKPERLRRMQRAFVALAAAALLALVFAAYLRPGFVLDVANRIWLCF